MNASCSRGAISRGNAYGLPSGEAVAKAMGEAPLTDDPLGLRAAGWAGETPLWLYFLAESASRGRGERLGPCGGRIVAEVLIGILAADRGSYVANEPGWRPTLPALGHRFGLTDLLLATDAQNARTSHLDQLDLAPYAVRVGPSHGQA